MVGGNAGITRAAAVVGSRLFSIVRLRQSREELLHSRPACFHFWKERMEKRFGHVHQWFESLCQERDIRRVALPRFIMHLERTLQDTPHRHCAKTVSLAFEKVLLFTQRPVKIKLSFLFL